MPKADVPVVKPIPVPASFKHPPPEFDVLPTHEFTMGLIAPKGAGKTTVICNLLHFYKVILSVSHNHRIIFTLFLFLVQPSTQMKNGIGNF